MNAAMEIVLRVVAVAVGLGLWFWTQNLISRKPVPVRGVGDRMHTWSAPVHAWLTANRRAANGVLITTSALIDVFGIYLIGVSVFGPTLRPFIAMFCVYTLRQVCQGLCSLPTPPGMIWRHPGVPSLLVTYGVGNDYFFSGHTAIAVIGAIQVAHVAPLWLGIAAAVVAVIEATTVIVLRAHYMIDVFAALFTAVCCWMFAGQVAPLVDAWLQVGR